MEDKKYNDFIRWAKACGHWQMVTLTENYELFLQNVPEEIREKVYREGDKRA